MNDTDRPPPGPGAVVVSVCVLERFDLIAGRDHGGMLAAHDFMKAGAEVLL